MANNGTNKELWTIYHGYSVDGGFGDAIWEEEVIATVEATEDEINEFVKKYDKPIVYDHPYDDLTAHHIWANKIEIKDIHDVKPYGEIDYFGAQAEEHKLREKYDEMYGKNWNLSDQRDELHEKFFKEQYEIHAKYASKEEEN